DVIGQVLPDATTTAFEYEDEDGDRITVRSDEEMKAMLSYYYSTVMEQQVNGQLIEPLQIYPRACKPPGKRNIHGLKVNTRAGAANNSTSAVAESLPSNSLKKSSAELKKILANGQMNEQDIRYRDILGHGNGGTVYKAYHVRSGKILAVKVIPLDITLELQKQIMSELEILYKCDSSYIIGFYGAFFVENRISLCTEFMDGGSLDVYRKIPEHVLGRIAVAVVKGLTYLWSLKILHR
ncbi:Dual specificity mitogen-activated protein kinase kinase 5, partial [Acanthisitta chloris]